MKWRNGILKVPMQELHLIFVNSDVKIHLQNTKQDTTELNAMQLFHLKQSKVPSWPWLILWWFDLYLPMHTQSLSPLTLWVRIPLMRDVLDATLCDKVCQWLETDLWFYPGTPVSSTNKTDRQNKVVLNGITLNDFHSLFNPSLTNFIIT